MAQLPTTDPTIEAIYQWHERHNDQQQRPYLGASICGDDCERKLWYAFRWIARPSFTGRMHRLFQTGHLQEPRMVEELRAIGAEVWETNPETGEQWEFSDLDGHMSGHLDALLKGIPEAPKAAHVCEFKTHSAKSFADLKKKGVEKSKPLHFAQMQVYMHWTIREWGRKSGCTRALYLAVNKDTDELYMERVAYNDERARALIARAERIIYSATPPARLSDDPSWFQCKFCDYAGHCHGESMPDVNCRTCAHSTPERGGNARWSCALGDGAIRDYPQSGCAQHRFLPPLIAHSFEAEDLQDRNTVIWLHKPTGNKVVQNDAVPSAGLAIEASADYVALRDELKTQGLTA